MKRLFLTSCLACLLFHASAQEIDLARWIQPVDTLSRFRLDSFMVWCGSTVKGDDGRYYLYYSRWPRSRGHLAWATHSEVALAVADRPSGPFSHVQVILPKRDKGFWDADVTHNPTVHKFGDTYYLYYMGNFGNGEWWDHRNHQRIGVATAKNPAGPWTRSDKPLIDTTTNGFDHVIASNPSVMKRLDGRYQMIYKGVSKGPEPFGGVVTHGAAIADHPAGPFRKTGYRIFIRDSVKFAAEDPYIWSQYGRYWAIVKDMKGDFTQAGTSLALFESLDGFDWKLSSHPLVSTTKIPWTTGVKKVQKLERPQLLIENGIPIVLYCAVYDGDDNYNIALPLLHPQKDPASSPPGPGYVLLYEENFEGDSLNLNDWQYRTGRRTGMGYMDGLNLQENVYLREGNLHIAVKHEQINGKWENTGGGIIGKHNLGYGYYETLSKPFMEGHGVHTSFWQRGGANPNNNLFEIDSYEIDSKTWVATNNLYVDLPFQKYSYTPWPHRAQIPFTFREDGWFLDGYEFTPEGVHFYDNGKRVATAEYKNLNVHQVVWLTALNGVGKVDSTKLPGESVFAYFRYYGKDYPGVTILPNGDFEYNQQKTDPFKPLCWAVSGTEGSVKITEGKAAKGAYKLSIGLGKPHQTQISQSIGHIMNGSYVFTARVRSSGGQEKARIRLYEHGAEDVIIPIKVSSKWKKIQLPDVMVRSNRISFSIEVTGAAGQWLEIDDVTFMKPGEVEQKEKAAPKGRAEPMWSLAKSEPIRFNGDQKFYFFDRNVGYGDSITISFDLVADVLANTTPIARIPKTGHSGWSVQTTSTGGLIFRIGSIAHHQDVYADKVYEPGKKVSVSMIFQNGYVSIFSNGKLIKKEQVKNVDTRDATAAGRLGTVGREFEAVGEVVMQVNAADRESAAMQNFRGTLQHLNIYNSLIFPKR